MVNDAQTQSGSLDVAVLFLIDPFESVKNIRNVFFFDALSRILYGIPDAYPVQRPAFAADGEGNGAFACILDRVVQKVDQNLFDADLIAAEHAGDGRVHMQPKVQPFVSGLDPDHIDNFRKKCACFVGNVDNFHFAGFDLGQIQNVVDERQQYFAGALNVPRVFRHILRDVTPQNDLVQSDDGIDGRTNFVAHAGEKMILRFVQLFDLFFLLPGQLIFLFIEPA